MAREFTTAEVAKHNNAKDCYVIIHGQVLDLTKFLEEHPGGKDAIMMFAGQDATEDFDMMHDVAYIKKYVPESVIGVVKGAAKL